MTLGATTGANTTNEEGGDSASIASRNMAAVSALLSCWGEKGDQEKSEHPYAADAAAFIVAPPNMISPMIIRAKARSGGVYTFLFLRTPEYKTAPTL